MSTDFDPTNESRATMTYSEQLASDVETQDPELAEFIRSEQDLPVSLGTDTTLRPKIIDACGLTCTFCHNEGTPVGADNRDATAVYISSGGKTGRTSIFVPSNNVDFVPGMMRADSHFADALKEMRDRLNINEVHFTGGEPSLHPQLHELTAIAASLGLRVKMTSNGEKGADRIPEAAAAGLEKVNYSFFGTTALELAEVQHDKYKDLELAQQRIDSLRLAIDTCLANGVRVGANIVMPDYSHADRVRRLLEEYPVELEPRVMADLGAGDTSKIAIYHLLFELGARASGISVDCGSSNMRVDYVLPDGRKVGYKQILQTRLPDSCQDCQFDSDCSEGYYGTRLYIGDDKAYRVGVCIQRMDLTRSLSDFLGSETPEEILDYRASEAVRLGKKFQMEAAA